MKSEIYSAYVKEQQAKNQDIKGSILRAYDAKKYWQILNNYKEIEITSKVEEGMNRWLPNCAFITVTKYANGHVVVTGVHKDAFGTPHLALFKNEEDYHKHFSNLTVRSFFEEW